MATNLILIRHGQTVHNAAGQIAGWTNSPLSLVGQSQAVRLAAHVAARYHVSRIYASPLRRARMTAQRIADRFGADITLRDDLKEINFGLLEGLAHAEVDERFPNIWESAANPAEVDFAWPGGESAASFVQRVRRAIAEIVAMNAGRTVAVVTHGGVLGTCVADIVEGAPRLWNRYVPANCSVTEIESTNGWLRVGCFNDCSFLVDDTPELARASLVGAQSGAGLD